MGAKAARETQATRALRRSGQELRRKHQELRRKDGEPPRAGGRATIWTGAIALSVGLVAGWAGHARHAASGSCPPPAQRWRLAAPAPYTLIEPLLACDNGAAAGRLDALEGEMARYADAQHSEGRTTRMSLYFRDLRTAQWAALAEHESYAIASLLKLPALVGILRLAKSNAGLLAAQVVTPRDLPRSLQMFPPSHPLQPSTSYTLESLLDEMIAGSDNAALFVLLRDFGIKPIDDVYRDLGRPEPSPRSNDDVATVMAYPDFFRLLYNATYLGPELSEKALSMLSRAEFRAGLVAGVPEGTRVAHKFAEGPHVQPLGGDELHDCGIVYSPDHPYILCVMTQGPKMRALPQVIAGASRLVFDWVQRNVATLAQNG